MGKISNGPNGFVSGTAGSVVFCKWKDINYVRSKPRINKNRKPTKNQAKQQTKFGFMQEYLSPIVPLVRLGFMQYAPNRTGHNSAMSYNIKEAVEETENGYEVNPEKFMFSKGVLPIAKQVQVRQDGADEILFSWEYDIKDDKEHKNSYNRTILLLYPENVQRNHPIAQIIGNYRVDEEERISIRGLAKGVVLHAYLAFFSNDGSNQSSDSTYVGRIEIQ